MTEGKTYRVVRDGVVRWVVVDLVDGDHSDATVLARVVDAQGGLVRAIRTTRDALEREVGNG